MRTRRIQSGLVPSAIFLVLLATPLRGAHAQCTRSCDGPAPVGSEGFVLPHSFTGSPDGMNPQADLVQDTAGNLYGTTFAGGTSNFGTVFKLDSTGTETVLHSFTGEPDGGNPAAGLVRDVSGNLYGTTSQGGTSNAGTVFRLDPAGNETVLYSFGGEPDGAFPFADIIIDSASNIYGTTSQGGTSNAGTVFKLDPAGNETVLYSFGGGSADGTHPVAGLVQDAAGNFYGTTFEGGAGQCSVNPHYKYYTAVCGGTVFKLDPTGTETVLHSFAVTDGANPAATLIRDTTGNLYGTTSAGGELCIIIPGPWPQDPVIGEYCGTVFKLDTSGNLTVLHTFAGQPDGAIPLAGLVLDAAGNLYGTTSQGGAGGCGTTAGLSALIYLGCGSVFKLDPTGVETVLYSFTGTGLEWKPQARLTLDAANNLYGTTAQGGVTGGACGTSGCGVVFELGANIVPPPASPPTFSPPGGNYTSIQSVMIGDSTADSAFYYTTDGSPPSTSSAPYIGVITVAVSETIKAIAVAPGFSSSAVASAVYTISTPNFSLSPASNSLTLQPGEQKADIITITPQNGSFGSAIQLTCVVTGPSPMPTCALAQTSVTPGANSTTSTLTVTVPASATLAPSITPHVTRSLNFAWISLAVIGFTLVGGLKKERRGYSLVYGFLLLILLQAACGSGNDVAQQSPQNYTVTVTGTSAAPSLVNTTQIAVTIQ
jgi:uncharacterized repeat protein (TIGR03803 family)